jgi:phosphoribosylformylglycinamidine cyclo-ligase
MGLRTGDKLPGLKKSVGEELLRVYRNYQPLLAALPGKALKGLAHITGGGLVDNLPRVLPGECDAVIETKSWTIPALFQAIAQGGQVDRDEMYQVFNMGIGMVIVASAKDAGEIVEKTKGKIIGRIEKGAGKVRLA